MKLIIAMIRPEKLEAVQAALHRCEVYRITASEVLCCGREQGPVEMIYRGAEFRRPLYKLRLEIPVDDWLLDAALEALVQASDSGPGGAEVLVVGLDNYVRTLGSERGAVAAVR
jgi:nitrogen regulatory protein P-II 2